MTLLIEIPRLLLPGGLPPLVMSGEDDATVLGVSGYTEPAMQPRIRYAPTSDYAHGDEPLSWAWQQSILGFNVFATAVSEDTSRALHAELVNAVTQGLRFPVTVTVGDAGPETWTCNPGTVSYVGDRTSIDLRDHNPIWSVAMPCQPVRTY